jgi:hypothetical protein
VINNIAVIAKAHINKGIRSKEFVRLLRDTEIVVIKLIEPIIDLIPARWREKIARSTEMPLWKIEVESGG